MTRHFNREIENLKRKILALGTVVEERLHQALRSLENREPELARRIVAEDVKVDRMEVELEEDCLKVLALYQPVAIDLRYIVAILKINSDLERIADLAVNMAQRAEYLSTLEPVELTFDYHAMAGMVKGMLKDCLDALVNLDAALARKVCAVDDQVDAMHRQMYQEIKAHIRSDPDRMDQYMQYLSVARYLERAADHATNIAEDVIYMVEGYIVRHRLSTA